MVFDLEQRLQKSKNNIQDIQSIMATWAKSPLYERASARTGGTATTEKQTAGDTLLVVSDLEERLNKRYKEIRDAGDRIHQLLEENRKFLQVEPNDTSLADYWKAYVEYIDEMVTDGFYAIVQCDLDFFRQETDRKNTPDPLFQITLEVQVTYRLLSSNVSHPRLFSSSHPKWSFHPRSSRMRRMASLISSMV